MKKNVLLSTVFIFSINAFSQTSATREHIKSLLEITGSAKLGVQMMENMAATFKKSLPEVPDQFWKDFLLEAKSDTLIELLIPAYTKHFSDEEIIHLIEFYKTPLGKKVVEKMPLIAQESYAIGEVWGRKISEQVLKKLIEKGYAPADQSKE